MKISDIYKLAIQMGIEADFRSKEAIEKLLERRRQKFEKLTGAEKDEFDQDSLSNPYSDSKDLHIAEDKEIKKD